MNDRISLPDGWQGWKIVGLIGSGSYGTVYKAERTVRGKVFSCAIKVISIPGDDSEDQMLRREYKTDESLRAYYKDLVDGCIEEIQMMDSLKMLFRLPAQIRVFPGHGMSTTIGDERSRYKL